MTIRVFKDHQLVGEHPSDHHAVGADHELARLAKQHVDQVPAHHPDDLLILGPHADGLPLVKRYRFDEWHVGGEGFVCGFVVDDPKCERCHPPSPSPSETAGNPAGT